ncbi:MAG: site-2 protease family protein [Bacteroidetes bacterium]|nr:site-2 protease family protein [Bacteroidota bacterium]
MSSLNLESIITVLPAILIGLTFHEYMHAKVAHLLGDDTAYLDGRVSINPLKHIDWIGFVFILIAGFGWAKPVSFNPEKLKNPRRDEMLIAIAGPIANFVLAIVFAVILKLAMLFISVDGILMAMILACIYINFGLFIFNMIPIPPLDGSHLLLKSIKISKELERNIYKYGSLALFAIVIIDSQTKLNLLPIGKAMMFLTSTTLNLLGIHIL